MKFKQYRRLTNILDLYYQKKVNEELTQRHFHQNEDISITEYFSLIQHYTIHPVQFTLPGTSNESFIIYSAVQSSVYKKLFWVEKISKETFSQYDGYLLFPIPFSQMKVSTALFHCSDGLYIDETLVCNGIKDCSEGTDEENCICSNYSKVSLSVCKYNHCSKSKRCPCSDYFYQCSSFPFCIPYLLVCDGHKDCQQGEDEICSDSIQKVKIVFQKSLSNTSFKCFTGRNHIPISFVDDLVPECPISFEDEAQYYNLLTNPHHKSSPCSNSNELPCVSGHNYCFPLSKLCVYDFSTNSLKLRYCRNGAHLHNCTYFQCLGYFKCPISYCIPFDLVCNGNWDCPEGHDEHNCFTYSCSHLFKCKNQNKCLHISKVCDKNRDCIYGDDELSCVSGYSFFCPSQCTCFSQSIVCDHLNHIKHEKMWDFMKHFKCYSCTLKFSDIHFPSITFLDIKDHFPEQLCISTATKNPFLSSLRKLDMSLNKITTVKGSCLNSLQSLKILYLQVNRIDSIEDKSFNSLRNLKILDLSYNKIKKLTKGIFIGLHNVAVINLTVNLVTSINVNTFSSIHQNTVHSFNKQVCCMAGPWLKCKVNKDDFSNVCVDLLSNKGLAQMCSFTGTFTVLTNLISVIIHIELFPQLQTNKFFTLGLSLIDCLYRMYLLIITCTNWYYKGYHAGAEYTWRQSFVCKASSFMTLVSLITSPIILLVLVLARFCVIQWPMNSKFKSEIFSKRIILAVILSIFSCCFILAVSFMYGSGNHVPMGVCLLLYKSGELSKFILFTSLLVICVQMICLMSNMTLTVLIIHALLKHSVASPSSKRSTHKQIIIRLLLPMFTSMCCWIPSSVVFFLPLVGNQVSNNFLGWVIVVVVPINFIADPIFYSILTPNMIECFSITWSSLRSHKY